MRKPRRRLAALVLVGTTLLVTVSVARRSTGSDIPPPSAPIADAGPVEGRPGPAGGADLVALIEPLRDVDAPDPFVVVDQGNAWLYTTNTANGNVPVWTWDDRRLSVSDALPALPAWAVPGSTWAPAVTQTGGQWVLAFTAATTAGPQCIGVATAPRPQGPYLPEPQPLVCDLASGGSIDPSFVTDDRQVTWLLFKDDGNCCGLPTAIRSVPLTADGLALAGQPQELILADRAWEGGLVEGPTITPVDGRWLLLYSANRWDADAYAIGAAWCATPGGPCIKQDQPALTAGPGMDGPGGAEFVGTTRIVVFHAWPEQQVGYRSGANRGLRIGRIDTRADSQVTIAALDVTTGP